MTEPLKDEAARARIREDFATTLVVEAAAGTGKTTELVRRIAGLLRRGEATLDRVVAVTFTDKAAGEMKLRLRGELERERQDPSADDVERARLEAALEALETAHIGTIHSFCLDLLRERPVEASVDPAFEIIAEPRPLLERAFDRWYQAALDDPPEALRRVLATRRWSSSEGPRDMLVGAAEQLVERRDFDAPWARPPFDRQTRIDALVTEVGRVGALADRAKSHRDYLARALRPLKRFADELEQRERVRERDYDRLEHELGQLARDRDAFKGKGSGKQYGEGLTREDVLARRETVREALEAFVSDAEADLAASLQAMLREVVDAYQDLKERAGALDYLDMLVCVRDMVQKEPAVRRELQERFSHLFVDEFQDTDPLQAEILLLIAADDPACDRYLEARPVAGKLFVVGDPKQAIYRFRRADVVLYQRIKAQLQRGGADVLYLTTSFRSLPAIQGAVNAAFEIEMTGGEEGWQADYVPLHRHRATRARQPAVVALPIPDPYSAYGNLANTAIRASDPEAVAAFVGWLVEHSGWKVAERRGGEEALVDVEARHVCLLFRGFHSFWDGDVTRPYVRGLEARKIPHVLVGGRAYHGREEVLALRAALTAIEWPHDELSVYGTLRGPFFSFGDDALFRFRQVKGRLHPLLERGAPSDEVAIAPAGTEAEEAAIAGALSLLAALHRHRNRRPIAATIHALLETTRAHAAIAIWPTGEQALANILRAMDDARRFEHGGGTSFRAFVEHLDEGARRGRGAEAPVLEEGTDGVRIMTVHGAKGLEFPVVILCDLAKGRSNKRPSRHVDAARRLWAFSLAGCMPADLRDHTDAVLAQDDAEAVRVTYVAATRARDLLVVPAVGDSRRQGWLDPLNAAIYPAHGAWRDAEPAPGCPSFGLDTVRYRPPRAQASPEHAVAPGRHRSLAGGEGAVWWDPHTLALDLPPVGGLRQTALLEETDVQPGGDEEHLAWRARRDEAIASASRPQHVASSITRLSHEITADRDDTPLGEGFTILGVAADDLDVAETDVEREGRPRGARFGTLVHAVLSLAPFDADAAQLEVLAASQALVLGATDDERRAAVEAAAAALAHPLMVAAARSSDCRREVPLAVVLDDGRIAEGIADLVFLDGDGWRVIDFKSDADPGGFSTYAVQLALYRRAVEEATGQPALSTLLRV